MKTMSFARADTLLRLWRSTLLLFLSVRSCALNLDGSLLLSFKYSVLSDPLSVLDNWDYSSESPCSWTGVTCAQIGPSFGSPDMFRVIGLVLPNSQLLASIPEEVGFIQHLRTVDLSGNFLNGTLPGSLFNSSELQVISLSNNKIYGELPELGGGGGLSGLRLLNLSDNALAGNLPENLTSLRNLTIVSLRSNYFSGSVPSGFDVVEVLDLSSNLLNGSLPDDFGGKSLRYLNLSYNKLSGSVSSKFAEKIPASARIDLSFNNLTGEIPESTALLNQKTESFSGNLDLCGKPLKKQCTIPSTRSVPPKVNSTSTPAIAAIPKTIDPSPVTSSNWPATTPNGQQTQQQGRMKPGKVAGIVVGDLAGIGILAMIILYVYQLKKKKRNSTEKSKEIEINKDEGTGIKEDPVKSKDSKGHSTWSCLVITKGEETSEATGSDSDENTTTLNNNNSGVLGEYYGKEPAKERSLVMVDGETELDLETLLKASAYILGSTGSNIVYKAVLADGTAFAVRRIGEGGVERRRRRREFENQVRALAKLRHPNLGRVRGFYWGDDEKLVIYDYISNGSLAAVCAGYNKVGTSLCHRPFEVRLKIAKGVARGLSYIHEKKHVHGNIKPNNILLNTDMDPVISDFGLDRLISTNHHRCAGGTTRHFGCRRSSSTDVSATASPHTSFVGCTSPYHAPESLENPKPNLKWDVYSFGIVLLELLTGKVFSDRELSQWTAGSAVEEKYRILRMADVAIRADVEGREDAMVACFKLGLSCASLVPQKRPSMKDALQVLEKLPCSS